MRIATINAFSRLCSLYSLFSTSFRSSTASFSPRSRVATPIKVCFFCSSSPASSFSNLKDSTEAFRRFGCSDAEISKIFCRWPSLLKQDPTILGSKLTLLYGLGLTSSDLVEVIMWRPRILSGRLDHDLHECVYYLHYLFGPKDNLLKTIIRNPSLLNYDHNQMKHCVSLYHDMGISKQDLVSVLHSRPVLISRASLNDEKLEYIRRTGVSKKSKMYKYVVSVIANSRVDTIGEKLTNFEKVGIPDDQVLSLFARSPFVLTLSLDKVQRNMTFLVGTMKLPPTVILQYPFLLYANLESVLKPRYLVAEKTVSMGLLEKPALIRALKMPEPRFLKAFVKCYPKVVADDLMDVYTKAKSTRRLAATSKLTIHQGIPF